MNVLTLLREKLEHKYIQLWIIVILTTLSYINIFGNGFVWDDYDLIVNNPTIKTWQSIPQILTSPTPGYQGTYRPVRYVLSILSYNLWVLNPVGYHLQTLVIHLIVTILVFLVLIRLTSDPFIPFITSLFFGIHPVHTEAITWISSGMDMSGIVFLLMSLYYFLKAHGKTTSLLFAALAFFSLELSLILPAILTLILWCFYRSKSIKKYLVVIPYTFLGFLYLFIRWRVIQVHEVFGYIDGSFKTTMLTMARAFLEYLKVLVWPVNLTVNHSLGDGIPSFMVEVGMMFPKTLTTIRAQSVTDTTVIISIGTILLMMALVVFLRKKYPLIAFAVAWILLTLLPVSNIIPTHAIMAERYLYLPSLGFCILLAIPLSNLLQSKRHFSFSIIGLLITVMLTSWYTILTIRRNSEWQNTFTLMTTAVQRNGASYIALLGLSKEYLTRKETDRALQLYEQVLTFEPEQQSVIRFLAQAYMQLNDYSRAYELIQAAIRLSPTDADAWVKLGDIYTGLDRPLDARKSYEKAIQLDPSNSHALRRLQKP